MTTESHDSPEVEITDPATDVEITDPSQIPPSNAWTREGEPDPDTIDQSPVDLGAKVDDK